MAATSRDCDGIVTTRQRFGFLTVAPGDRLTFRGCGWDDGWEFDAPVVLYEPVQRYGIRGSIGNIEGMVEDVCIDLCVEGQVPIGFSKCDLKEFEWRGRQTGSSGASARCIPR